MTHRPGPSDRPTWMAIWATITQKKSTPAPSPTTSTANRRIVIATSSRGMKSYRRAAWSTLETTTESP